MKKPRIVMERLLAAGKSLWADEKKRGNLLLCAGLAGLLLLAFSEWLPQKEKTQTTEALQQSASQADYAAQLETRLRELISSVDGAGETRVMVTLQTGEQSVYATDKEATADGDTQTSHVLLGSSSALIETVNTPQVLGVAVVCEGGADAAVQRRVTELVAALTGVGTNHITVAKMAQTQ